MPWLAVNEQILKQIYKKATIFVEKENLLKHENAPNQGTAIQVLPVSYPWRSKFARAKTFIQCWKVGFTIPSSGITIFKSNGVTKDLTCRKTQESQLLEAQSLRSVYGG
jgi:hypothetical protein